MHVSSEARCQVLELELQVGVSHLTKWVLGTQF